MLRLGDAVQSLSFCSQRGDLLLEISNNLNFVHHKQCEFFFIYSTISKVYDIYDDLPRFQAKNKASYMLLTT